MALKAKIELVTDELFGLGEGPHWDALSNKLYIVDAFVGDFVSVDLNSDAKLDKVHFDDIVTFIVPYADDVDKFIVSRKQSICQLDWSTKELKELVLIESGQNTRFNDAKCDRRGRLWAGTMGNESQPGVVIPDQGSLYSFSGNQLKHQVGKVSLSNGLDWSPDGHTMFFADSAKRKVYSFRVNEEDGSLSNQQVFFDFDNHAVLGKEELPDGMSIDATGSIWLASYDGGRILHIDQETGALLNHIAFPVTKTTSLCFGGENMNTMFVTSANFGLSSAQSAKQPLAGGLFKVNIEEMNIRGSPNNKFNQ
ncbi:Regucalcin [Halotydeus destructor]|nr:Regucalcin [Halotydeus destructor]